MSVFSQLSADSLAAASRLAANKLVGGCDNLTLPTFDEHRSDICPECCSAPKTILLEAHQKLVARAARAEDRVAQLEQKVCFQYHFWGVVCECGEKQSGMGAKYDFGLSSRSF